MLDEKHSNRSLLPQKHKIPINPFIPPLLSTCGRSHDWKANRIPILSILMFSQQSSHTYLSLHTRYSSYYYHSPRKILLRSKQTLRFKICRFVKVSSEISSPGPSRLYLFTNQSVVACSMLMDWRRCSFSYRALKAWSKKHVDMIYWRRLNGVTFSLLKSYPATREVFSKALAR